MEIAYKPHFNSEFETLIERIHPPSVCIDNQSCHDCTLVKVDSANKHGILLEMVQVLTDLDLVISKSYICSDGGWFMDVFHVTDHQGNKITDESLILYIQQAMCANRRAKKDVQTAIGRQVKPRHVSAEGTALEITGTDRPGLLSEISAVLAELECNVTAAVVWTHNTRVACIIHVEDERERAPITDLNKIAYVQAQLESVVEAHHRDGERRSVRLTAPAVGGTHTERRLHQLMSADRDYEVSCGGNGETEKTDDLVVYEKGGRMPDRCRYQTKVTIDYCKERGYSLVNVRCRDRPKLLFDTVCTLTDLEYVVFHASISSKGSIAIQEYYIRHMDGCWMESECERRRVIQCLVAATERRISHGLRLDVCTRNRVGLLSDITRAFRENGLSITRAEIGTHGEKATGSFYVIDTSGHEVKSNTVEMVRQQIGGTILMINKPSGRSTGAAPTMTCSNGSGDVDPDESPKFSLGNMLWSHIERISNNFRPVRS